MKRCSNPLVIRKRNTSKYYLMAARSIIGKLDSAKGWQVCSNLRTTEYHWWEGQQFWRAVVNSATLQDVCPSEILYFTCSSRKFETI